MKYKSADWEWEKRPRRVEKGADKTSKHRKSIYNMLSDEEDDFESDSEDGEVKHNYTTNSSYTKRR